MSCYRRRSEPEWSRLSPDSEEIVLPDLTSSAERELAELREAVGYRGTLASYVALCLTSLGSESVREGLTSCSVREGLMFCSVREGLMFCSVGEGLMLIFSGRGVNVLFSERGVNFLFSERGVNVLFCERGVNAYCTRTILYHLYSTVYCHTHTHTPARTTSF